MRPWLCGGIALLLAACGVSSPTRSPGQANEKQRVEARLALAAAYFAEGQAATALQELDQVLEIQPRHPDALGLRALALVQVGEPEQATKELERALSASPEHPGLNNNMGWLLCQRGQPARAITHFEKALSNRHYDSPVKALLNAGLCSARQGDWSRAENYFRRALQLDPAHPVANAKLAQLSYERNDFQRARMHILKSLSSAQVEAEYFLIAVRIERKLGDPLAEHSLMMQWRRKFPDSPQLAAYLTEKPDD